MNDNSETLGQRLKLWLNRQRQALARYWKEGGTADEKVAAAFVEMMKTAGKGNHAKQEVESFLHRQIGRDPANIEGVILGILRYLRESEAISTNDEGRMMAAFRHPQNGAYAAMWLANAVNNGAKKINSALYGVKMFAIQYAVTAGAWYWLDRRQGVLYLKAPHVHNGKETWASLGFHTKGRGFDGVSFAEFDEAKDPDEKTVWNKVVAQAYSFDVLQHILDGNATFAQQTAEELMVSDKPNRNRNAIADLVRRARNDNYLRHEQFRHGILWFVLEPGQLVLPATVRERVSGGHWFGHHMTCQGRVALSGKLKRELGRTVTITGTELRYSASLGVMALRAELDQKTLVGLVTGGIIPAARRKELHVTVWCADEKEGTRFAYGKDGATFPKGHPVLSNRLFTDPPQDMVTTPLETPLTVAAELGFQAEADAPQGGYPAKGYPGWIRWAETERQVA